MPSAAHTFEPGSFFPSLSPRTNSRAVSAPSVLGPLDLAEDSRKEPPSSCAEGGSIEATASKESVNSVPSSHRVAFDEIQEGSAEGSTSSQSSRKCERKRSRGFTILIEPPRISELFDQMFEDRKPGRKNKTNGDVAFENIRKFFRISRSTRSTESKSSKNGQSEASQIGLSERTGVSSRKGSTPTSSCRKGSNTSSGRKGSTPKGSDVGSEESSHLAEDTLPAHLESVYEDDQESSWQDPSKAAEAAAKAHARLSRIDSRGSEAASAAAAGGPASAPAPTAAAVAVMPAAEQPREAVGAGPGAMAADSAAAEATEMCSTESRQPQRTHTLGVDESVSARI